MLGLIGKKLGMTQIFDEDGKRVGVTVLEVGPCYVTALRTKDRDGYTAVQLGFEEKKEKNVTKPRLGQFKKAATPILKYVREIRTENVEGLSVGASLGVNNFEPGDYVDVEGISIGKGFQGVVKRLNFKAGEAAHGSKFGREPGSTGMSAYPSRVIKGTGMPGQMGSEKVTTQNLKVVKVDEQNNLLVLQGAVPGAAKQCVVIKTALKKPVDRNWKVPSEAKDDTEKPAGDTDAGEEVAEVATPETSQEESK